MKTSIAELDDTVKEISESRIIKTGKKCYLEGQSKYLTSAQHRGTKADTLKATEANRRRGPGTREKVRSKRMNLEGNTHAQEINVSQLPV
jgi:hypothetical protein